MFSTPEMDELRNSIYDKFNVPCILANVYGLSGTCLQIRFTFCNTKWPDKDINARELLQLVSWINLNSSYYIYQDRVYYDSNTEATIHQYFISHNSAYKGVPVPTPPPPSTATKPSNRRTLPSCDELRASILHGLTIVLNAAIDENVSVLLRC